MVANSRLPSLWLSAAISCMVLGYPASMVNSAKVFALNSAPEHAVVNGLVQPQVGGEFPPPLALAIGGYQLYCSRLSSQYDQFSKRFHPQQRPGSAPGRFVMNVMYTPSIVAAIYMDNKGQPGSLCLGVQHPHILSYPGCPNPSFLILYPIKIPMACGWVKSAADQVTTAIVTLPQFFALFSDLCRVTTRNLYHRSQLPQFNGAT